MKVFSPFLNGNTTTSGSFNVPNHPGTGSIPNPLTGSLFHDDTDGILKVYTGTQWQVVGEQAALVPAGPASADIEYLLVAGGGAGGGGTAGGGGAGGYLSSSLSSVESGSSFTVTVGAGGASTGVTTTGVVGNDGVDSSIAGTTITTITATAGGGGGDRDTGTTGRAGGSGGGGGGSDTASNNVGGSSTTGQGNDGGDGRTDGANSAGGGGGGAGQVGADSPSNGLGGDGGDGLASPITGTSTTRAGGGGGGSHSGQSSGGTGGGGAGATSGNLDSVAGTPNTGGGGGGAGGSSPRLGNAGGSGVAIFAYDSGSINAAGGIVGDAGNGRKYHQFNSSGTFKVGNTTTDFQIVTDSLYINYDAGNFASRGTSTWTDLQGNHNTTVNGATLGNNFYYNFASNDYMVNSIPFTAGTTYTFCWWMNVSTSGTTVEFICEGTSDDDYMIHLGGGGGNQGIRVAKNSGLGILDTANAYTSNTWEYFCAVFSPTSHKLYKNGSILNSDSDTTNTRTQSGINIGIRGFGGTNEYFLNGNLALFQIYSKELSPAEVLQNYNATKTNFV